MLTTLQPAPGAMPGSDTEPSTLSAKNAADDKLPTLAYTFKNLSADQSRAIYREVTGAAPASARANIVADIGTELPLSVALSPMPADALLTKGYAYVIAGDKLLLVSPANRVVVGVITQ